MAAGNHRRTVRPGRMVRLRQRCRDLAVLRDGRRAPRGTASRNLYYPCCYRDGSEIRPRTASSSLASGDAPSEPVSGDRMIRFTTAAVVCAVAAFAAVVSYSHIYGLGRAHGQDGTAVRLLPLSVDGLILAASLVLLHEARNGRVAPALARLMLWLGIAATIGANIAYGARYGLLGALISAWPAVAFIGAVEIATQQVKTTRGPRRPPACQPCQVMWSRRSAPPTRRRSRPGSH